MVLHRLGSYFMILFFYFFIRNEEDYINIRTNTGEIKETREREKKKKKPREG